MRPQSQWIMWTMRKPALNFAQHLGSNRRGIICHGGWQRRGLACTLTSSATLAIQSWKCHLLRSTHQHQARLDVIDALDSETVFVVNDWAMKFLPQRYRESRTDWIGKRGISWHISVVYRRLERELQWQGFIQAIQSCSQGSCAVVTIIHHALRTLKREHPEINKA